MNTLKITYYVIWLYLRCLLFSNKYDIFNRKHFDAWVVSITWKLNFIPIITWFLILENFINLFLGKWSRTRLNSSKSVLIELQEIKRKYQAALWSVHWFRRNRHKCDSAISLAFKGEFNWTLQIPNTCWKVVIGLPL